MNKNLATLQLSDILDLPLQGARGRRPRDSGLAVVRNLDASDVASFNLPVGAVIRPLVKLRQRHHHLARLLAAGSSQVEAAAITGYGQSTISILQQDPAFQELMDYYTSQKKEIFLDVQQRLAAVGMQALEEIADRLEDEPSKVSMPQLESLVKTAFDRSVAPPKGGAGGGAPQGASAVNVTVEFVQPAPQAPTGPTLEGSFKKEGEDV